MSTLRPRCRAASVGHESRIEEGGDRLCRLCTEFAEKLLRSAPGFEVDTRSEVGDRLFSEHDLEYVGEPFDFHSVYMIEDDSSTDQFDMLQTLGGHDSFVEGQENASENPSDNSKGCLEPENVTPNSTSQWQPYRQLGPDSQIFHHHARWSELVNSAQNECKLCYLILYSLRWQYQVANWDSGPQFREMNQQDGSLVIDWYFDQGKLNNLRVCFDPLKNYTNLAYLEVFTNEDMDSSRLFRVDGRSIMPHASLCFPMIRQWMNACLKEHGPACAKPNDHLLPPLPTRVIDVNAFENSKDVRLCLGHDRSEPYLTLSHCWGTRLPLRSTEATFQDRITRIPFMDLPLSFRDSIQITRVLGFRYIWIDSLCIIQDSAQDWATEAARMAQAYTNSFMTIASACSSDSSGGMLLPRPGLLSCNIKTQAGRISLRCNVDRARPFKRDDPNSSSFGRTYQRIPEYAPLTKRAWCFQEQFLSSRILYFTSSQLYWYCNSLATCEGTFEIQKAPYSNYSREPRLTDAVNSSDPLRLWCMVVEGVTDRLLSYDHDKLVCLSGVASEFQKLFKSEYLAGLWAHDIHTCLVWHMHHDEYAKQAKDYRAPSWSWAASDGQVSWGSDPRLEERWGNGDDAEILSSSVELCDPRSQFGQVKSGFLELTATCGMAKYKPFRTESGFLSWEWEIDGWGSESFWESSFDHYRRREFRAEFLVLQVSAWVDNLWDTDSKKTKEAYTAYLIAEPVSEGTYQRVGLGWAEGRLPENCGWERKYIKIV